MNNRPLNKQGRSDERMHRNNWVSFTGIIGMAILVLLGLILTLILN